MFLHWPVSDMLQKVYGRLAIWRANLLEARGMNHKLSAAAALLLGGAGLASAQIFTDDFNRADGGLGASWTTIANSPGIVSNTFRNTTGGANSAFALVNTATANYDTIKVSADISLASTALGFVGLAFGHNGSTVTGNGLFIKLQGQTGTGNFSHVGFYTANSTANATAVTGGAVFFALDAEFTTARMTVWASDPVTINLGLDTDFNGTYEQSYSRTLGVITLGNQFGMGAFGTGIGDNFRVEAVPEPMSLAALGLGAAALLRRRRRA
jgi:hypothetical protein